MVPTNDEFRNEPQYTEVLSRMLLITLEKIGKSGPVPFKRGAKTPLEGIRAFGMGHVIAGALGRRKSRNLAGSILLDTSETARHGYKYRHSHNKSLEFEIAQKLGEQAHERVREHFLITRNVRR